VFVCVFVCVRAFVCVCVCVCVCVYVHAAATTEGAGKRRMIVRGRDRWGFAHVYVRMCECGSMTRLWGSP
jgi:hypothetical protein